MKRALELLAPARDLATAREAIMHGADAVYIGAPSHGARARAVNSLDDIKTLVGIARPYGVKVYVTVNTIVYDDEIQSVMAMIRKLYSAGVDALIVQDMGLLEMDIPPIALHASTQCDTRTVAKARMLQSAGFSQIVVARELSLAEIGEICRSVTVPVEAFVHGALCVCYSGDCQASFVVNGRSANRGNCAQMCRLPYDLIDGDGNVVGRQKHYLSLRDLNRIDSLLEMAEAGVASFKIEGRLKDASYVKNVTAAYRAALDNIISAYPDRYCRPSRGISHVNFIPSLSKAFNRGFTDYFLKSRPGAMSLATFDSPKSMGEKVGSVVSSKGRLLRCRLDKPLANGDGLTYVASDGSTGGFRANRVEGNTIALLEPRTIPSGSILYRSFDREWESSIEGATATRLIPVTMRLRMVMHGTVVLEGTVEGVGTVSVSERGEFEASQKPDNGYRLKTLSKLGGTVFTLNGFEDEASGVFVPASVLAALRRRLCDMMLVALDATKRYDYRRKSDREVKLPSQHISRHDNVSNRLARKFYEKNGAESITPAVEITRKLGYDDRVVMTARYCLRREMGACLREGGEKRLKGPLKLRGAGWSYELDFDCAKCQMRVLKNYFVNS